MIKVFDQVVNLIYLALDQKVLNVDREYKPKHDPGYNPYYRDKVSKEGLSYTLNVPEHLVARCLNMLRQEGFVTGLSNRAPHDSTRDRWGGSDSAWCPSYYTLNLEKFIELRDSRKYL